MDEKIFYRSALHRHAISAIEGIRGSKVSQYLRLLDRTQRMSRDEIEAMRLDKLRRLIAHTYKYVPYYHDLMKGAGMAPGDIRSLSDFRSMPVITKPQIRENLDRLKATGSDRPMKVARAQTGGTTGEPLKFLRDEDCISFTRAALLRSYAWTGYRIGDPMLFLTGGSLLAAPQTLQQRIGFKIMNYHFMPGFKLQRESLEAYTAALRRKRIRFLRGYSTLLHQLAALCEEAGVKDIKLDAVYPTAEMLTKAQRDTIERVFDCRVYDHYGCAEINTLANECPEGRKLHIIEEHTIIEEIRTGDGGEHSLIVTDLDNYAQPFIRYANGDRGRVGQADCACGRNLAVLEEFLGRSSDDIYLASGERYPGVFFHHLFGHFDGVTQFQVIQDDPGRMTLKLVPNDRYENTHEDKIKSLIAEHTGIIPVVEYCSEILRPEGQKITSVICNVKSPRP